MKGGVRTVRVNTRVVWADGREEEGRFPVLRERRLSVVAQGARLGVLTCTDTDLELLVLGWLYTHRLMDAPEELIGLTIQEDTAHVSLSRPVPAPAERRSPGRVGAAPPWRSEDIFTLARRFREGLPLHRETGATHSCFLMRGGAIVYSCEDVGRFNAVDKAVGYALRQGIPLRECLLYSSGRVSEELVTKLAAAGVPVLVSKAIPTAQAVERARSLGMVLICRAWEDRYEQFA